MPKLWELGWVTKLQKKRLLSIFSYSSLLSLFHQVLYYIPFTAMNIDYKVKTKSDLLSIYSCRPKNVAENLKFFLDIL